MSYCEEKFAERSWFWSSLSLRINGQNLKYAHMANANLSNSNLNPLGYWVKSGETIVKNLIPYEHPSLDDDPGVFTPEVVSDLSFANLENANLDNANLHWVIMTNTKLIQANLSEVNLKRSNLQNSDFSGAVLSRADFTESDLRGAIFTGADLRNASFANVLIENAIFSSVKNAPANFIEWAVKHGAIA